jgi:hypothetical protein
MTGTVHAYTSKADGTVTQERRFKNVILNQGLKRWFSAVADQSNSSLLYDTFGTLYLGTGVSQPSGQDQGLETPSETLAGKGRSTGPGNRFEVNEVTHEFWQEIELSFAYGEGEAHGIWTELGLGDADGVMFTRALFRDENGEPASLAVATDEFLTVIYRVRYQDGIGEPQWQTATIGDQTFDYKLSPNPDSHWLYLGFWRADRFPFNLGSIVTNSINRDHAPTLVTSNFDTVNNVFSLRYMFDPDVDGFDIATIKRYRENQSPSSYHLPYRLDFNPPIQKASENRLTLNLDIQLEFLDPPITGLELVTATNATLEFTWDTLPNATEYVVELYSDSATPVNTLTVTAPTQTVLFENLEPDTTYTAVLYGRTTDTMTGRSFAVGATTF